MDLTSSAQRCRTSALPGGYADPVTARRTRHRARHLIAGTFVVAVGAVVATVLAAGAVAAATTGGDVLGEPGEGLTVVETLLLFVIAPGAIFVLIALVVVGPSLGKGPRHRTGEPLESGPVWIDPAGVHRPGGRASPPDRRDASEQGGASARW